MLARISKIPNEIDLWQLRADENLVTRSLQYLLSAHELLLAVKSCQTPPPPSPTHLLPLGVIISILAYFSYILWWTILLLTFSLSFHHFYSDFFYVTTVWKFYFLAKFQQNLTENYV